MLPNYKCEEKHEKFFMYFDQKAKLVKILDEYFKCEIVLITIMGLERIV